MGQAGKNWCGQLVHGSATTESRWDTTTITTQEPYGSTFKTQG